VTKVDSFLHAQSLHIAACIMQILATFSLKNSPFVHLHVEMTTCCHGRALKFVPRGLARRLHSSIPSTLCQVHPPDLYYLRRHEHGVPCLPPSASSQMISRVYLFSAQYAEKGPAKFAHHHFFHDPPLLAGLQAKLQSPRSLR